MLTSGWSPDVLLSLLEYSNIVTVFSVLFSKERSKIILCEQNNPRQYLSFAKFRHLKFFFMKLAYNKADRIIVSSEGVGNVLHEDLLIPKEKIVVIYNPIELPEIFKLRNQDVTGFPETNGRMVVISAGRLTKQKNFELLLKSFKLVRKNLNVLLIILGVGELERKLRMLAEELMLANDVYFAGFQHNPFSWIVKADVFVLTSDWEGFGNVIIESMACGVPVVATNCPFGPGEIIENGRNGFLAPVGDPQMLADSIAFLLNNKSVSDEIVKSAFISVQRFDSASIVAEYEKVLRECIANGDESNALATN